MSLRVAAVLAAGTCLGFTLSCQKQGTHAAAPKEKTATVAAVRVERHDLASDLELAAEFRPYQEVEIHAKVAGYLKAISVDVGDRLSAGQLIAILEVPEFAEELAHAGASEKRSELDVVRAESEVTRAQSAHEISKVSYDRLLAVSKSRPNLIAQQEIDIAAARFREYEAQLATAKAALASTREQVNVTAAGTARVKTMMNYLRITAPFSGVVTKRYADTGAMIQAGTASQTQAMPVIRLSQVDRLRLILPVPESIVARVKVGNPVEVRVDSLKRVFQGRVSRFTGRLNSATRTMETEVDLANPGGVILPGMYGFASLVLDKKTDTLAIPVQAVSGHGTKPTVLVVNSENRIEERPVSLGIETPNLVEVVSGLRTGELVIIGNRGALAAGKKVEPKLIQAAQLTGGH